MAESTLTMTYDDLVRAVCLEAGYPPDAALRSDAQDDAIDAALATGLRRAYFPGSVTLKSGRILEPFMWSFMKDPTSTATFWPTYEPTAGATVVSDGATPSVLTPGGTSEFFATMVGKTITVYTDDSSETEVESDTVESVSAAGAITLAAGQTIAAGTYRWGMEADGDYRMEDAFGGATGTMALDDGIDCRVPFVPYAAVRDKRAGQPSMTGRPIVAAVVMVRQTTAASPQRWVMRLFPIPDQVYVGTFPVVWLLSALSDTLIYHAGGMPYSEVFRTAVIAAVVSQSSDGADGRREQEFQEALAAAALWDRNKAPQNMGSLGREVQVDSRRETIVRTRYIGVDD